jgi:hypothetical protein
MDRLSGLVCADALASILVNSEVCADALSSIWSMVHRRCIYKMICWTFLQRSIDDSQSLLLVSSLLLVHVVIQVSHDWEKVD